MNPVFPSILSTTFFDLESRLTLFNENKIDFIHLDVMDGHFVDNISFGPAAAKAIKGNFPFKIDAHLMVSNPGKMIPKYMAAGCDWISFHLETQEDIDQNISSIKKGNTKAGLVLNPDSHIEKVFPYISKLDYILLMSVFPGYGGQKFIPATIDRVAALKKQIKSQDSDCLIQVDGGVNLNYTGELKAAGCDLFVIGTFLFNAADPGSTLNEVLKTINGA